MRSAVLVGQWMWEPPSTSYDWFETGSDPWPDEYQQDLVLVADSVTVVE